MYYVICWHILITDNKTIDWQRKETARAKMRTLIKRLLRKHKYPPEGMDDAVQTVMTQCELWTDNNDMSSNIVSIQEHRHFVYEPQVTYSMVEAFATFEYKKGIAEISNDDQILALLPEAEYQSYYKNLMYRLVLHGGSHKEEQVKVMSDFHFFSLISDTEKKRTAKDILCFIYLLNKRHLLEHLKNCGNIDANITTWCQDIKARAAII